MLYLGIVILESDLEFHSFEELPFLLSRARLYCSNAFQEEILLDLRHDAKSVLD